MSLRPAMSGKARAPQQESARSAGVQESTTWGDRAPLAEVSAGRCGHRSEGSRRLWILNSPLTSAIQRNGPLSSLLFSVQIILPASRVGKPHHMEKEKHVPRHPEGMAQTLPEHLRFGAKATRNGNMAPSGAALFGFLTHFLSPHSVRWLSNIVVILDANWTWDPIRQTATFRRFSSWPKGQGN